MSGTENEITNANPEPVIQQNAKPELRDSRCCFHFTKYETFIYIVGIFGIVASVTKVVILSMHIVDLHDEYPVPSTYVMVGIGIGLSMIVLVWETVMMFCVRKRKITGLQHYMFATLLILLGSSVGAAIAGGAYKVPGLFLSYSFIFDAVRSIPQMFFVHKFIKSEKLAEDSHYIAAYYKRF